MQGGIGYSRDPVIVQRQESEVSGEGLWGECFNPVVRQGEIRDILIVWKMRCVGDGLVSEIVVVEEQGDGIGLPVEGEVGKGGEVAAGAVDDCAGGGPVQVRGAITAEVWAGAQQLRGVDLRQRPAPRAGEGGCAASQLCWAGKSEHPPVLAAAVLLPSRLQYMYRYKQQYVSNLCSQGSCNCNLVAQLEQVAVAKQRVAGQVE